jgi:PTS system nitrogen regulatory IIA component
MILTLKELAEKLKVNERTVMRMQQSGQLRGVKIGGQWRFNSSEIDRLFFPGREEGETMADSESVPLVDLLRRDIRIPVSRILSEKRVMLDLNAVSGDEVINQLSAVMMHDGLVMEVSDLRKRLLDREKLLSTGIGKGVAIPHPRDPMTSLNASSVLVFARTRVGVDFGAIDNEPVRLFFLLCCKDIEMHLHMMGQLARLLQDDSVIRELLDAESERDVLRVIMQREQAMMLD